MQDPLARSSSSASARGPDHVAADLKDSTTNVISTPRPRAPDRDHVKPEFKDKVERTGCTSRVAPRRPPAPKADTAASDVLAIETEMRS
jgi:hypothetical protein